MKILITGSNGLVGSALKRESKFHNHKFYFITRNETDFTKENEVESLFKIIKPDAVVHTAAKVGGIGGNLNGPADYFYQNILMNSFIVHFSYKYNVKKLIAFSSVCVFPQDIPILKEELMHQGDPHPSQFAYASAKRAMDIQIQSYKKQYEIKGYCSIIPTNIFGIEDNYNLQSGHVIPSLIHKIYNAKKNNTPLNVWGTGIAKREFLFADDLAKIIMKIMELNDIPQRIIISRNGEVSIKEVVEKLCKIANFNNEVIWETDKPNGILSRPTDLTIMKSLIGEPKYTDLDEALETSYKGFEENYKIARK